jgi:hypothetical protein
VSVARIMVTDLLNEMRESNDWTGLREKIHDAFDQSQSSEERGMLLAAFTAMMDSVERQLGTADPDLRAKFQQARCQDYNLFVVKECTFDGNVSPEMLNVVTLREVQAGRMAPDHELRRLAIMSGVESTPAEERKITPPWWKRWIT